MSASAVALPRRGLSDRDCGYVVSSTRPGDLSRVSFMSVVMPPDELIEADAALTCSAWFLPTANAMFRLTSLPPQWDSRSARRVERTTIERALRLLAGILEKQTAQPSIVPTVSGGVQAEWHRNGLNVEIEFYSDREAFISLEDLRDGSEWEGELYSNLWRLAQYLERLG